MPQVPDVQMTWPISHIAAVTPADATDLPGGDSRLIWVTGAGDVVLVTAGGETVTLAFAAGQQYPYAVSRVKATGTTATGIWVGW
jgi:hypothetical protein